MHKATEIATGIEDRREGVVRLYMAYQSSILLEKKFVESIISMIELKTAVRYYSCVI